MFRARLGVRTRILAIALVPSLTLLLVGAGSAGYLVAEGNKTQEWASQNQLVIPSAREFLVAVQEERQLTLAALSGDESSVPTLVPARLRLDSAFKSLMASSTGVRKVVDSKIGDAADNFITLSTELTKMRTAADARQLPVPDAYAFYNALMIGIVGGAKVIAGTAPDPGIATQLADGVRLFRVFEAMSRSHALGGMIIASNGPTPIPMAEFLRQIGFYHSEITNLSEEFDPTQKPRLQALMASQSWQQLTIMENALAQQNTVTPSTGSQGSTTTSSTQPPPLPISTQEWQSAAAEVNRGLIDIWLSQNEQAQKLAEDKAAEATTNSAYAGAAVIVISLLALVIAVLLANRFIRRLKRLRGETLALADERLPDTMRRLRDGEDIDPAAESPDLDYGHDEIGQVAKAFQHAHAAAVAGAVNEARTREGVKAVFLNIAHRSQLVVHRQLEILDKAEERQEDPAMLDILFKLDHLATRERRNAENLIILGGGRPGRQWRNPVPLIDLLRSAVGETLDYAQVRVGRLPEAHVIGGVVADLIHLLAELVDNATSFSPPQSRVEVTGSVVGKGVVVEIDDQGMGMAQAEIDRINDILRQPPDFGVAALSADTRLGLFVVAQLAASHHVLVRLTESDYGGIRAIVLIPSALLAAKINTQAIDSQPMEATRRRRQPVLFADPATGINQTPALTAPPVEPPARDPEPPRQEWPVFDAPQPTVSDGRPALPRRRRQASLAPELAQPTPAEPAGEQEPQRERSAEQARDLMSAIETGTRQGRHAVPEQRPVTGLTEQFGATPITTSHDQEGYGDFFQPR